MRVSALTSQNDWRFGRSQADYLIRSDAVAQNVVTRLRSFKNDWFLDFDAEIDWLNLLGKLNTRDQIRNEVTRVIVQTQGVLSLNGDGVEAIFNSQLRELSIRATITPIYQEDFLVDTFLIEPAT